MLNEDLSYWSRGLSMLNQSQLLLIIIIIHTVEGFDSITGCVCTEQTDMRPSKGNNKRDTMKVIKTLVTL